MSDAAERCSGEIPPMSSVAAMVLAAGASRRLGESKQLVRLNGETLLERAVRVCSEAGCSPVVVVLGASAAQVRKLCALGDAAVVTNDEWSEGMGSSVRRGVRALPPSVKGCVITMCDQPAVTAEHLRALMASGELTASAYAGRRGVPAYFPLKMFAELMDLRGDAGARQLLKDAKALELANGELDVDTPADLERARRLFEHRPA
jgi:CTP:molybdopterin cytidylyltransferase MocA